MRLLSSIPYSLTPHLFMRIYLAVILLFLLCYPAYGQTAVQPYEPAYLTAMLDTIYTTEQEPIRRRDALMKQYGVDSPEAEAAQKEYRRNHAVNIKKIRQLLDTHGWPDPADVGERSSRIISNVLQHATQEIRIQYLPMMKQAVEDGILHPRWLVRAEDRLLSEQGELQLYGGQMKYYPETKSFNVWPVFDPENIDKRRAAIGLGPIAEHLKNRFDFEWDLEEQIQRTKAFEAAKHKQ